MNQSQILDFLGLQGGKPLQALPVIVLADFSETAVGEFLESRGLAGAQEQTGTNFTFPDFFLSSRASGGLVISDIRLAVWGDVNTALSVTYNTLAPATWLAQIVESTVANLSATLAEATPMAVGGTPPASVMASGVSAEATLLAGASVLPTERNASGIGTVGDIYTFTLQPGVRWFIPPGSGLRLFPNSRPTGGTARAEVSITWREVAPPTRV